MPARVGAYLRAGVNPQALADAMEQLQDELAALRRRRDDMARLISDGEARGDSGRAAGRG